MYHFTLNLDTRNGQKHRNESGKFILFLFPSLCPGKTVYCNGFNANFSCAGPSLSCSCIHIIKILIVHIQYVKLTHTASPYLSEGKLQSKEPNGTSSVDFHSSGVTFLTLEDLSDAFFQKSVTHSALFLSPLLSPHSWNHKAQP